MTQVRFCFLNTYLLRVPLPLVPGRHLHAVPAVRARASEVGAWLSGRHDVVALSEVFEPDDRAVLAAAFDPEAAVVAGPGPRRPQAGSGLAVLSAGPSVVRSDSIVFAERGRRLFDSDAWADKGALAVELDDGLEVVVTHLLAGDDLPRPHRHVDGELARRRRRQVDELLALVDRFHVDGRPLVLAGDFNIDADGPTGRWLRARFAELGFVDAGERAGLTNADGRIDYVFVRDAEVESCVAVMADRADGAPEREALPTLSDHAALEVVLDLP